ncbi:MAG: TrmB family transcriptional regulator sugar-binding domain-containing protein [Candidatus Hodarchaeales archaeon]
MVPPNKNSAISDLDDILKNVRALKSLDPPQTDYELFSLLSRFGLTKYEVLAYIALIERGPQTISQLTGGVSKTGIPQPRAYDVIGSLIRYGLVEEGTVSTGKEKRKTRIYRPLPPEEGLDNLMNFFIYAKEKALKRLKQIQNTEIRKRGGIWEISKRERIIRAARRLLDQAEEEVLIVAELGFLEEVVPLLKRLHNSDRVLISVIIKSEKDKHVDELFDWMKFMKIRYRGTFSMPYLIIDKKYALQWESNIRTGQEIENTSVINTLIDHFFFSNWRIGRSFTDSYHREFQRDYPLTTVNIISSIEEIDYLFSQNIEPIVKIRGFNTKTKEKVDIEGRVIKTEASWNTGTFSLHILSGEDKISVGGMLATLEDITAEKIEINHV